RAAAAAVAATGGRAAARGGAGRAGAIAPVGAAARAAQAVNRRGCGVTCARAPQTASGQGPARPADRLSHPRYRPVGGGLPRPGPPRPHPVRARAAAGWTSPAHLRCPGQRATRPPHGRDSPRRAQAGRAATAVNPPRGSGNLIRVKLPLTLTTRVVTHDQ